jgi:anti-sigma B factor antagonist
MLGCGHVAPRLCEPSEGTQTRVARFPSNRNHGDGRGSGLLAAAEGGQAAEAGDRREADRGGLGDGVDEAGVGILATAVVNSIAARTGPRDRILRMDIRIDRVPREDGVELTVIGRLDAESAGELRDAVAAEVRRGEHQISLDLAGVTFLSSAGIRVLFETQREARAAGGECLVCRASGPVQKVLELTRLDRILMRPVAGGPRGQAPAGAAASAIDAAGVRLVGFEPPPAGALRARLVGSAAAVSGGVARAERLLLPPHRFAIGLGGVADEAAMAETSGELLAACGAVFHRPPREFAAVDYLIGSGELVPEIDVVTGLVWEGLPGGRAGFEAIGDPPAVGLAELATALLDQTGADALAVVFAGEVHGLVAAELIRPLAEATPADHPLAGTSAAAARWLCFSREPVHAGRTSIVVGVVTRACRVPQGESGGPLGEFVTPLGAGAVLGHLHAVVFPHRPLKRTAGDLAAVVADLAASEPLAVVHLVADDRPVLGSGTSEFVRGRAWFAPLSLEGGAA